MKIEKPMRFNIVIVLALAVLGCGIPDPPFVTLCLRGTEQDVRAAITSGQNVNARYEGVGAVGALMPCGSIDSSAKIKLCLENKYNVNYVTTQGRRESYNAFNSCRSDPMGLYRHFKLLLEYGLAPNWYDDAGQNELSLAARLKDIRLIRLLVSNGFDPDKTLIGKQSVRRFAEQLHDRELIDALNVPSSVHYPLKIQDASSEEIPGSSKPHTESEKK